ncbi:MAG: RNA 2'-phosphotransferase [Bacteroidota bacterium]
MTQRPQQSERHDREQYFFDVATRDALVEALVDYDHVCCLCAPTLAEALAKRGQQATLLDLDERFAHVAGFRRYDLTRPDWIETQFDVIVSDPPFFTVSLTQLHRALAMLAHHRVEMPVLVAYLTRRDRKLLTTFAALGFCPTGFFPSYATVADTEKNEIQFYGTAPLPERGSSAWMDRVAKRTSKFLSLVLRHDPDRIGITLGAGGWTGTEALLRAANQHGVALNRALLEHVVATNAKQRFALSDDGARIRANQGHSVQIDLGLTPVAPPAVLFHGTARKNLASIHAQGLVRRQRHHVHLSADEATARTVGQRHGTPVVLRVEAARMHGDGHVFYRSDNGVWLTEAVPPTYLTLPDGSPPPRP